ncbi:polymorphic toxin-type HINT domain-containing protein, partial [Acetivibrio straminisolvens]|uniref:polymorphic toxin-type HINT domain-containing protein n=1 Tax=Acetivibrio straminisolvens TaxID=253314 RepID=UPI0023551690
GDKVIATNPETFEVAEKTVLETYVRDTTELLHLTINGEVIKTTFEHPFYVKDVGFVEAGKLQVGDKLVDSRGNVLVVEEKKLEITDKPVKVYNFKVDNFHTYHVGENRVLVHNANKYVKGTSSTTGKQAQIIGATREQKVANITGGQVSGAKIKSSAGGTDIDVIGPNGELIMVGGPAKANDLGKLGQVIKIYQDEAAIRGVGVKAYFAEGTPQNVIDFAIKKLSTDNVVIFK